MRTFFFLSHSPSLLNDDLLKMDKTGRKHTLERNVRGGDELGKKFSGSSHLFTKLEQKICRINKTFD